MIELVALGAMLSLVLVTVRSVIDRLTLPRQAAGRRPAEVRARRRAVR